jgi:hypothetical protein
MNGFSASDRLQNDQFDAEIREAIAAARQMDRRGRIRAS